MIAQVAAAICLKTMGEPLDVAYVVHYIGSAESKYIRSIELSIEGGILAGSQSAPKKHQD